MSDPQGENPESESGQSKPGPDDAQKAIHRNLNSFLNPAFRTPPQQPAPDPNGALQLRMAQMELANKMRLQKNAEAPKAVPMKPTPPPGGFGSAQGVFHMRRGNFGGKKAGPTASKRSPYQQVLANASAPEPAPESDTPAEQPTDSSQGQEVIDVPVEAEVKQNEKPKRLRGKRFRNPTL